LENLELAAKYVCSVCYNKCNRFLKLEKGLDDRCQKLELEKVAQLKNLTRSNISKYDKENSGRFDISTNVRRTPSKSLRPVKRKLVITPEKKQTFKSNIGKSNAPSNSSIVFLDFVCFTCRNKMCSKRNFDGVGIKEC